MEKSFVDKALLGQNLDDYKYIGKFQELNAIEKVLLIRNIAGSDPQGAQRLAEYMQMECTEMMPEKYNVIFDTVMNMNSLAKGDINDAVKEMEEAAKRE